MAAEDKKNAAQETEKQETALAEIADVEVLDDSNIVKLKKPLHGKDEIVFDFDKIKGSTLLKCEKKAKEMDSSIVVPQLSMVFQAHVAAAAASVKYDDIANLSAPDFMAVTLKISRFLNGAD